MRMKLITPSLAAAILAVSSQAFAADPAPVRAVGRVRLPPPETQPTPVKSTAEICLTADKARERRSPATAGLQAQCDARLNADRRTQMLMDASRISQPAAGQAARNVPPPAQPSRGPREDRQAKAAGDMVKAGDCQGAQDYALSIGNFVLAQQIKDYCSK